MINALEWDYRKVFSCSSTFVGEQLLFWFLHAGAPKIK